MNSFHMSMLLPYFYFVWAFVIYTALFYFIGYWRGYNHGLDRRYDNERKM